MRTCWGLTKEIQFCGNPTGGKLYCDQHRRQLLKFALIFMLPGILTSYIAGLLPVPKIWNTHSTNQQKIPVHKTLLSQQKPSSDILPDTTNTPIQDKVFLREKSPGELIDYLKTLCPMDIENIIKTSYIGKLAHWKGKINNIKSFNDCFMVSVFSNANILEPLSYLILPARWRHKLETLKIGEDITFEGMIKDIDWMGVTFIDSSFITVDNLP